MLMILVGYFLKKGLPPHNTLTDLVLCGGKYLLRTMFQNCSKSKRRERQKKSTKKHDIMRYFLQIKIQKKLHQANRSK